jgi:hypothetical protein
MWAAENYPVIRQEPRHSFLFFSNFIAFLPNLLVSALFCMVAVTYLSIGHTNLSFVENRYSLALFISNQTPSVMNWASQTSLWSYYNNVHSFTGHQVVDQKRHADLKGPKYLGCRPRRRGQTYLQVCTSTDLTITTRPADLWPRRTPEHSLDLCLDLTFLPLPDLPSCYLPIRIDKKYFLSWEGNCATVSHGSIRVRTFRPVTRSTSPQDGKI